MHPSQRLEQVTRMCQHSPSPPSGGEATDKGPIGGFQHDYYPQTHEKWTDERTNDVAETEKGDFRMI